jgi:hypothetical protein
LLSQAVAGLAAAQNAGIEHGHLHANRIVLTEPGEVKICGLGEPLWLHEEQAATTIGDLEALSEIAADWLSHSGRKAFASAHREAIKPVLQRLLSDEPNIRYPSAAALIDHLHDVAVLLADDGGAWSKLLNFVHERLRPETPLRKTA